MDKYLQLTVNGKKHELPAMPGEMLADVLRNRLRLTGTKVGCGEAECGACTIILDGEAVLACVTPAEKAVGGNIQTIEGLAQEGKLHALQDAFIKYGAVQCGFCTPGQIMAAHALLLHNPEPTQEEIRTAMKDTLCRCAGYPSIEGAIDAAALALRSGKPVQAPIVEDSIRSGKVVGRTVMRPEAVEKVNGTAIFTDDLQFPGMLQAVVKRAGVPHGIVRVINTDGVNSVKGVKAVLTAVDIPGEHTHGLVRYDWPVLVGVGEHVRYQGDAIAIVAAETKRAAQEAVEKIVVELEELPIVSSPVQSYQADAPLVHEGGNLLKHIKVRKGEIEKGFEEADVTLEEIFQTPIMEHAFLEPECSIAVPLPDGRMEIHVGSQIPYADREQVARALGWEEERVRIVGALMGGGFGGKEDIAGQIHAALLANATGRPVKLLFDRHESMIVHPKRHATQIRVKVGAKLDGRICAVETELYGDTGAYASLGDKVMTRATTHSAGPYEAQHVRADCYAMYTNNPPAGAFRGFGVTQSAFAVESLMDMLANVLGMDCIAFRRRNALRVGSITNTGQVLRDSVGLIDCIDAAEAEVRRLAEREAPGWNPFTGRDVPETPHLRRAWGFAVAYKNTGLGGGATDRSCAEVELYEDGALEVRTSAAELGQGLVTVLRMMVAEEMGQLPESVRVLVMDTDLTPDGGPTTASRQTYVSGNAARLAACSLRQAITSFLAEKHDQHPESIGFGHGTVEAGGKILTLGEVAKEMTAAGIEARALYEYTAPVTKPLEQGGDMHFAFAFAAQAAEVEINSRTGEVRVVRLISANDAGTAINPLGLKGQVEGGAMMGVGSALTEHFIVENGRIVTDRLARYRMPSIVHTPEITSIIIEHPTSEGPYGAKGIGEIVSIPTAPAITNAIYNATGIRLKSLPVDQEEILRGMTNADPHSSG